MGVPFGQFDFNKSAKIKLSQSEPGAAFELFKKAENMSGCAYCAFLMSDYVLAKELSGKIEDKSTFDLWLNFLINICEDRYTETTYFRIRMFYEQDADMLLNLSLYEAAEKVFNANEYISGFNREVYKYSGRVLLNNGYVKYAEKFLNKSLDVCYNDPETHFILSEVAIKFGDIERAVSEISKTLEVCPGYKPAENKLKELTKRL